MQEEFEHLKPYRINWEKLMDVTCTLAVPVEAPECYEDKETVTFREIYDRVTTEGSGWEPFSFDPILKKDEKHYYMQNASAAAISLIHSLLKSYRYSIKSWEISELYTGPPNRAAFYFFDQNHMTVGDRRLVVLFAIGRAKDHEVCCRYAFSYWRHSDEHIEAFFEPISREPELERSIADYREFFKRDSDAGYWATKLALAGIDESSLPEPIVRASVSNDALLVIFALNKASKEQEFSVRGVHDAIRDLNRRLTILSYLLIFGVLLFALPWLVVVYAALK